jgi:hypothetical protein
LEFEQGNVLGVSIVAYDVSSADQAAHLFCDRCLLLLLLLLLLHAFSLQG